MIYVLCENHNYFYEIYEIIKLYYPYEKITQYKKDKFDIETKEDAATDNLKKYKNLLELNSIFILSSINIVDEKKYCECRLYKLENINTNDYKIDELIYNKIIKEDFISNYIIQIENDLNPLHNLNYTKKLKHIIKLTIFNCLKEYSKINIPWGILVGIRPTKLLNELKALNIDENDINNILKNDYKLSNSKISLVNEVSKNSLNYINKDKTNISIYIGIPFCPTKCSYCSFASYSLITYGKYENDYMKALEYEIKKISNFIKGRFKVENIYIGGGTPTSLSNNNFSLLLKLVNDYLFCNTVKEYTVEAGRPDTINKYKLDEMKKSNVTRISINPQTMNDDTLQKIGRKHRTEDIIDKFKMARELGFNNINMDIILGLPDENIDKVKNTLNGIIPLEPENITVHTMAVKRGSNIHEKLDKDKNIINDFLYESNIINNMIDFVYNELKENSYSPYYMYRQKMMIGNMENVGYCKKGYGSIYNIQIIEEKQTIIGLGADSVTKAVYLDHNRIERFANKKDLKLYIETIQKNTDDKISFLETLL